MTSKITIQDESDPLRISSVLKRIQELEYIPLISQNTVYFKKSHFAIYKSGAAAYKLSEMKSLAAKLNGDQSLLSRELQMNELFLFFLRDNCYVDDWDLNISSDFTKFNLLPLRTRPDVQIFCQNQKTPLPLCVGQVLSMSSDNHLKFCWQNQSDDTQHSIFAASWASQ